MSGHWLSGVVAAVDGFGVVLASNGDQHAVIRMEAVSAVKIAQSMLRRTEIPAGAHPMPGPGRPGTRPTDCFSPERRGVSWVSRRRVSYPLDAVRSVGGGGQRVRP